MIYNNARLTIGQQVFEGLRMTFEIQRATALYARATIEVYNMSLESYNALVYDAISTFEILTETGYQTLFVGNFRLQQRRMAEASSISELSLFESVLLYKEKTSLSLESGCTGTQILQFFKDKMPSITFIVNSKAQTLLDNAVFKGGYTAPVSDYYTLLTDFINDTIGDQYAPYFDNARITIGETQRAAEPININTGMIGIPEFTKRLGKETGQSEFRGKVSHKILPLLSIYDKIKIESQYLRVSNASLFASGEAMTQQQYESVMQPGNGLYIAKKITHKGDTHKGVPQTDIEFIGASNDTN